MRRCTRIWPPLLGAALLAGCAHAPVDTASPPTVATREAATMQWRGRLALRVDAQEPRAYFANFELAGQPQAGSLLLLSPLGTTLARLHWDRAGATLLQDGQPRVYASLDELLTEITGAALPVAALFGWLRGHDTTVQGWVADLSRLGDGRLTARREHPAPVAELRVILDPP